MNEHSEASDSRYYENEAIWSRNFELDTEERARLDFVTELIPLGVRSILDVGCGNGAFVHRLLGRYDRVCGVDRSETALRFVQTEHRRAGAEQLPFGDGEFDMVTCMEVIEHLPESVYDAALRELARVADHWLMITVPYREDRRLDLIRCPRCLCEFNRSYHLRSFDDETIRGLFATHGVSGVRVSHVGTVGVRLIRPGLQVGKRLAAPFRELTMPRGAVCPQCQHGAGHALPADIMEPTGIRRGWQRIGSIWPARRVPRWYVAVFEKF
jgi:SAM-dependent methyltransferase